MLRNNLIILFLFFAIFLHAQCDYNITNLTHINCYGENQGSIDIILNNNSVTCSWLYPDGSTTNTSQNIQNLYAGDYTLSLYDNSNLVCVDTISVLETIPIIANFNLSNICDVNDSVDVQTTIYGGTPPYMTLWNTGDTSRNVIGLPPTNSIYSLTITDVNSCIVNQNLIVPEVLPMQSYMSSVGAICKDDDNGSATVFVSEGTSPFSFRWLEEPDNIIENNESSTINHLFPGEYVVEITDAMGCQIFDTVFVTSNPKTCLTIYKAFSPNDDAVHEFWEIKNIHFYPKALILVYDRNGRQVYRRRDYRNEEEYAFGGQDQEGRVLPSGNYYYVIDLENGDDIFKGVVTIVR